MVESHDYLRINLDTPSMIIGTLFYLEMPYGYQIWSDEP